MKIFVTGATGVIGRRAVPLLIAAGHRVTAVGRTPEKRAALERLGAETAAVDLFDVGAVRAAVAGHEAVCNLATHIPPSSRVFLPGAWRENDRIRSVASANLVEAALAGGAERFIQESFGLIYPDRGDEWIDETVPLQPARYNRSVIDAERAAERFNQAGGTAVVLRFAGFYGPDSGMLLDLIKLVRKGWVPLPSSPEAFISSVSHDDAATAVVAALGVPAGVYNVVDDEPLRRREYFGSLAAALGVKPPKLPPAWMARLMGSLGEMLARSERISNRKLRAASGWAPKVPSVREGWRTIAEELREPK
jgi:nucleoside-diphosphate-sugar epimerase